MTEPMDQITIERVYIASVEQSNAIKAAADKECTREGMARCYRDCIIADTVRRYGERVNWSAVNAAILARWPKGLAWIEARAWKLLEQK